MSAIHWNLGIVSLPCCHCRYLSRMWIMLRTCMPESKIGTLPFVFMTDVKWLSFVKHHSKTFQKDLMFCQYWFRLLSVSGVKNNKVLLLQGHEEKMFDWFFHYPMTAIMEQGIKMAIIFLLYRGKRRKKKLF